MVITELLLQNEAFVTSKTPTPGQTPPDGDGPVTNFLKAQKEYKDASAK